MNRRWIIAIILVAVAAGGYFFLQSRNANEAETETTQLETTETVFAFTGELNSSVTASGQILAQRTAALSLQTSGEVSAVNVQVGDMITAGDVLVQLDTAALERAVLDAEQSLRIQEANFETLLAPPSEADVAAAEANVASAQAQLDNQAAGPTAERIAASEASIRAAEANVAAASSRLADNFSGGTPDEVLLAEQNLAAAQTAYTQAEERHRASFDCEWNESTNQFDCEGGSDREKAARGPAQQAYANLVAAEERLARLQPGGNSSVVASGQASVASAQANLDAAVARHEKLLAGTNDADIASAAASLAQAQSQLDNLMSGPSDAQIEAQQAQVEQAGIALQRAQNNLAKATLHAPFDGTVTAVHVSRGEIASGVAIELIDMNSLEVELDVDEVDLGELSIGQPAMITLEAWPEAELSGEVVTIAPESSSDSSGIVSYVVNLMLGEADVPILNGMTADASMLTDDRGAVLLVPNEAIIADRSNDTYTVNLVEGRNEDGALIVNEIEITIGLRDGDNTEITSGIEDGMELAVNYREPPRTQLGPPDDDDN